MLNVSKNARRGWVRRAVLAAGLFAAVLLTVAPASADHRRHRHYHSGPRVAVLVGLPPIALRVGAPVYSRGYYGGYDYEDGYDDGYRDRAREEWRRRHYRHHHHRDCDHDYDY